MPLDAFLSRCMRQMRAAVAIAREQIRRVRHLMAQSAVFVTDVYRFRPRLMIYTAIMMAVHSLTEGIGLVLLIPLIGLVGAGAGISGGQRLNDALSKLFGVIGVTPTLEHVLGLLLGLAIVRAALGYVTTMCIAQLEYGFLHHIRARFYDALSHADWPHLVSLRQSHTSHRLTLQAEQVGYAVGYLLHGMATFLGLLVGIAVAWVASPTLTATVLVGALVLAICLLSLHWWAFARGAAAMRAMQHLFGILDAGLEGLKLGRAFSIERALAKDFTDASNAYRRAAISLRQNESVVALAQEVGSMLLLVLLVFASLRMFAVSSLDLLLLIAIFSRLLPRAIGLQTNIRLLVASLPDYNNFMIAQTAVVAAREVGDDDLAPIPFERAIKLHNVSVTHAEAPELNVLSGISFEIPLRSSLGVVGHSGAGKSTLADLLAGFIAPSDGHLLVDGRLIDAATRKSWRSGVIYVDQHSPIFRDTIRANIVLKARTASDADIWRYLDMVHAGDLVRGLPHGLDTVVGEGSARLSGGELQRLRLASALLAKPRLLILDEATNALSPSDERQLITSIAPVLAQSTVLSIAHRPTSVAWTDRLLVLQHGRLAAHGATAEILRRMTLAEMLGVPAD
jgi:ATP-binding cassette, subfamily C, bacterial